MLAINPPAIAPLMTFNMGYSGGMENEAIKVAKCAQC